MGTFEHKVCFLAATYKSDTSKVLLLNRCSFVVLFALSITLTDLHETLESFKNR